jgi:tryptophanyl-tRNA synthetase
MLRVPGCGVVHESEVNRMQARVFSGIQPSGSPTLGNFLGAIRNWARDQYEYDNLFCVVDLHALTLPQDPEELRQRTWETAAMLLAAGIDPERSLLFLQSQVPEHTTLAWLLTTITPLGWLNRMTQFKVKSGSEQESTGAGILNYPVLMAADILAYRANFVPVGDDQKQHVELTRDIAERFNRLFGETFVIPEPVIPRVGARVMSLDDPAKKMSKSDPGGAVFMLDTPDVIRRKVSRAVTDSLGVVRFSPEQRGLYNLLSIHQSLSGRSADDLATHFAGGGYHAVKEEVAELIVTALTPIQERYRAFTEDPGIVDGILEQGAERARSMASPLVRRAMENMGLRGVEGSRGSAISTV